MKTENIEIGNGELKKKNKIDKIFILQQYSYKKHNNTITKNYV